MLCMETRRLQFDDLLAIKRRIYALSYAFEFVQICDSNQTNDALNIGEYELIAAFGNNCEILNSLSGLEAALTRNTWKFGAFHYPSNWKRPLETLKFFEPDWVIRINRDSNEVELMENKSSDLKLDELIKLMNSGSIETPRIHPDFVFKPVTSKHQYLQSVESIRDKILHGVFYEMNYCIEFNADWLVGDLLPYMLKLNEKSAAPFAVYAKTDTQEVLCSSPERFLRKTGDVLVSQPIKGTNHLKEGEGNLQQMAALKASEKERAENVMIVDLVRNDLARVCKSGSVKVDELFGTYPFKTLNHMISTVSGTLQANTSFTAIFEALFPMGSMTGAPKIEVMKHIEQFEDRQRGLYSGCIGYVEPNGNFDFNVVIRTLEKAHTGKHIHYKVGSAITFDSVPELEYDECLLKGQRLESIFRE